jgi:hypothetical protein
MVAISLVAPRRPGVVATRPLHGGRYVVEDVWHAAGGRVVLWGRRCDIGQPVLIERISGISRARLHGALARADALLALAHPHLARCIEVFAEEGAVHVVMVPGMGATLAPTRHLVARAEATAWGVQICNALNYLAWRPEAGGIVPTIDPTTVFVSAAGRVRLVNLAALLGCPIPRYRSRFLPLVAGGAPRIAVFGIGATLHHTLTGWQGRYAEDIPPLGALRPDCAGELSAVIDRALAGDPAARWRDPVALRQGLLHLPQ